MEGFKSIALLLNCPDFSQAPGQKGESNLTESPFPTKITITVGVLSPFAPTIDKPYLVHAAVRKKSGSRACGCRWFFVIRKTAPSLTTGGVQNLRAKEMSLLRKFVRFRHSYPS